MKVAHLVPEQATASLALAGGLEGEPASFDMALPLVHAAKSRPYSKTEWDTMRPTIERLWHVEDRPWNSIIRPSESVEFILRDEHDFAITRKQFLRKIKEWGLYKNVKDKEKREIDDMERMRKDVEKKDTITKLRGREVSAAKLQRWRRNKVLAGKRDAEDVGNENSRWTGPRQETAMPMNVEYQTPRAHGPLTPDTVKEHTGETSNAQTMPDPGVAFSSRSTSLAGEEYHDHSSIQDGLKNMNPLRVYERDDEPLRENRENSKDTTDRGGVSVGSLIGDNTNMGGQGSHFTFQLPSYPPPTYLTMLEAQLMRDFACCEITLPTLHDLIQHCEECHGQQIHRTAASFAQQARNSHRPDSTAKVFEKVTGSVQQQHPQYYEDKRIAQQLKEHHAAQPQGQPLRPAHLSIDNLRTHNHLSKSVISNIYQLLDIPIPDSDKHLEKVGSSSKRQPAGEKTSTLQLIQSFWDSVPCFQLEYKREVKKYFEEFSTLELANGPDDIDTLHAMRRWAEQFIEQGCYTGADLLFPLVIGRFQRALGKEHPETMGMYVRAAENLSKQWKFVEVGQMLQGIDEIAWNSLPLDHMLLQRRKLLEADLCYDRYQFADSVRLRHEAFIACIKTRGLRDGQTLIALSELTCSKQLLVNHSRETGQIIRHVLKFHLDFPKATRVSDLDAAVQLQINFVHSLYLQKQDFEADNTLFLIIKRSRAQLGLEHPIPLRFMTEIAARLAMRGKFAMATPLAEEAYSGLYKTLNAVHRFTLRARGVFSQCLFGVADLLQEHLYQKFDICKNTLGHGHRETIRSCQQLGWVHSVRNDCTKAVHWYQRARDGYVQLGNRDGATECSIELLRVQKGICPGIRRIIP